MTESTPRTHGSLGILVVGLGGANGVTMLAGILANRRKLQWRGPHGEPMSANYNGCITQLKERGVYGGVGFADKILTDANMAAVGGWDIRPAKLGDALLDAQILDYDLVRQVQDDMNRVKVFKGYYDERFIGSSQHKTATHTMKTGGSCSEALDAIRADIRYFKWRNGVVGHTTVIWSASVEPNCEFVFNGYVETANDLLACIAMTEEERGGPLSPSLLYATASILEGCSFVNGGSQNTLCGGLEELARAKLGVYCLGTDFKAGQTKFKTAAVEYIRTMGLTPKVIASSNHLGNNDMRNLASADKARLAKLRVKHDIFAAWEEDIDHKVSVMFCPMINDEKRDFVEYTSLGFLGQTHTMVTYTRASDSVLCVPLMIDAAVFCDFFAHRSWPYESVSKALAYLFKVPEGAAKGVDPGFFRQMDELRVQINVACGTKKAKGNKNRRVRIRNVEKKAGFAISDEKVIVCAGLACVDMQLGNATGGKGDESIDTFEGETSIGGGSVSMVCKTLARLCHGANVDKGSAEVPSPVFETIIPICKVGHDSTGEKLISLLENCGQVSRNIDMKYTKINRDSDQSARTALAVLPIYNDGRRGCFFDAASNKVFEANEIRISLENIQKDRSIGAFVFGYPHLLPQIQGESLADLFLSSRSCMDDGGLVVMDLNGVPNKKPTWEGLCTANDLKNDPVIGEALAFTDILHLNEDELALLTGYSVEGGNDVDIVKATSLFLQCGVAVVAVTRGRKGCYIACNNDARFSETSGLPPSWANESAFVEATTLPADAPLNTNGAGDSFTAGLLIAAMLRHTGRILEKNDPMERNTHVLNSITSSEVNASKKCTPLSLYIEDNRASLKFQFSNEETLISKCEELWDTETEDTKAMYQRRCVEELEDIETYGTLTSVVMTTKEQVGSRQDVNSLSTSQSATFLTNRTLNLQMAAHVASTVASFHVNSNTRDDISLDFNQLLTDVMGDEYSIEEI